MNNDPIYEREALENDPLEQIYRMLGLYKVGIASTDSAMNVDLNKSGHCELYATLHHLALEAIQIIEESEAGKRSKH